MNLISSLRSAIHQIAMQPTLLSTIALPLVLGLGTSAAAFIATKALLLQSPAAHELSREFTLELENESVSSANQSTLADLEGTQLIRFSSRIIAPAPAPQLLLRLSDRVPDLAEQLEQELQEPIVAQTLRHHSNGFNLLSAAFGPALLGIITALAASIPTHRTDRKQGV